MSMVRVGDHGGRGSSLHTSIAPPWRAPFQTFLTRLHMGPVLEAPALFGGGGTFINFTKCWSCSCPRSSPRTEPPSTQQVLNKQHKTKGSESCSQTIKSHDEDDLESQSLVSSQALVFHNALSHISFHQSLIAPTTRQCHPYYTVKDTTAQRPNGLI